MIDNPAILTGVVLSGAHGIFEVHTDEGVVRSTLRGKLKKAFAQSQAELGAKTRGRGGKAPAQHPVPEQVGAGRRTGSTATRSKKESGRAGGMGGAEGAEKQAEEIPVITRLTVGDHVKVRLLDEGTGVIEEILPRQSALSRLDSGSSSKKAVQQTLLANLDQVVIVLAVAQPVPHFGLLDRYLAICESADLRALVCLNKADLAHEQDIEQAASLYEKLGYRVLWTSAHAEQGIEELREILKDHTTLFTGPSGVGKSSLVNVIEPGMALRTGLISSATGKGRHTTTGSQLYPLTGGGWLADSAGIRALAAWNVAPEELASCFVEFRPYIGECVFADCLHIEVEGCAIIQALEDGVIDEGRYRSYVRMFLGEERVNRG